MPNVWQGVRNLATAGIRGAGRAIRSGFQNYRSSLDYNGDGRTSGGEWAGAGIDVAFPGARQAWNVVRDAWGGNGDGMSDSQRTVPFPRSSLTSGAIGADGMTDSQRTVPSPRGSYSAPGVRQGGAATPLGPNTVYATPPTRTGLITGGYAQGSSLSLGTRALLRQSGGTYSRNLTQPR